MSRCKVPFTCGFKECLYVFHTVDFPLWIPVHTKVAHLVEKLQLQVLFLHTTHSCLVEKWLASFSCNRDGNKTARSATVMGWLLLHGAVPEHGEYQAAGYTWPLRLPMSVHTVDGLDGRDGSRGAPHNIQGKVVSVDLLVGDVQDDDAGNLLSTVCVRWCCGRHATYAADCHLCRRLPSCHEMWGRNASCTWCPWCAAVWWWISWTSA